MQGMLTFASMSLKKMVKWTWVSPVTPKKSIRDRQNTINNEKRNLDLKKGTRVKHSDPLLSTN